MKISIRSMMAITLTAAMMAALFSPITKDSMSPDFHLSIFSKFALAIFTPITFCASGASIAYDRVETLRSAARGALNAFYIGFVLAVLAGLFSPGVRF